MNQITPRYDLPLPPTRKERDADASKFQLTLHEDKSGTGNGTTGTENGTTGTGNGTTGTENGATGTGNGTTGTENGTTGTENGTTGATGTQAPLAQAQVTAPKSAKRPELEKIANDPTVSAAIDKAWKASNPNGPGAKQEKGFWISKDDKTGALSVTPFPDNGDNDSLTPGSPPSEKGKTVIAFFHTHPNTNGEGYKQGPSPEDEDFAKAVGVPGLIRSHDGMYYFGPKLP